MAVRGSLWQVSAPSYSSGASGALTGLCRWARVSLARVSDQVGGLGHHTSQRPEDAPTPDAAPAAQTGVGQRAAPDAEYDAFIREHQRAILNYLWRMTGDEQNAYDLTQEVFVRAWRHFGQLRGYASPRAWLFRVATNLALSSLRLRKTTFTSMEALGNDREPTTSDPAWRVAERDLVRIALAGLPPQRRAALTLREVYGLSCVEVARALGISDAAARMTLSRAREQFRELYVREGGDERGA